MFKVGITGGIGSGKSTVCRLFAARGVAVYDCDAAAKRLMAEDEALKGAIVARFGEACYCDGVLNRSYLAEQIFGSDEAREAL
ncbi:MAG: dephospho-CoA kinase, partial [Alistipes sp.]|nr:dephospho-CoA kinase [Alistipes sp.]